MIQETANEESGNHSPPSLRASKSKLNFHPGSSASFPGSIKIAVSFVRPRCAAVLASFLFRFENRQQSLARRCWKAPSASS